MASEEPIIQGLLMFPPISVLVHLKKSWHKKYCQLFRASNMGIQRLEIWDTREDILTQATPPRILTLEACVKIAPGNQPKIIVITTKCQTYYIGCYTEEETNDWMLALQQVAFGDNESVHIEKDNDLYTISSEGIFSVKLIDTVASKRCKLEPKIYTLVLCVENMKLVDKDTVLFVWPYKYIRKYGHKDGKFTFEAGRKCESGEGSFHLQHSNHQEIFHCLSSKMKFMKKILSSDGGASLLTTQSGIDFNELQHYPGLCMEAGSRSPLPPNLSTAHSVNSINMDYSIQSQKSQTGFSSSSNASLNSLSYSRPSPPATFNKQDKLTRNYPRPSDLQQKIINFNKKYQSKNNYPDNMENLSSHKSGVLYYQDENDDHIIATASAVTAVIDNDNSDNNNEDIYYNPERNYSYDQVEFRRNAWKTRGVDVIPHVEKRNYSTEILPNNRIDINNKSTDENSENDNKNKIKSINSDNQSGKFFNNQVNEDNKNIINDDVIDEENRNDGIINNNHHNDDKDAYDNIDDDDDDDDNHSNNGDNDNDDINTEKNDYSEEEKTNLPKKTTISLPMIFNNQSVSSTLDYDQLQHIVPSYKINDNSTYDRTKLKPSSVNSFKSSSSCSTDELPSPSWDDYDIVDIVEDVSAIKLSSQDNQRVVLKNQSTSNKTTIPEYKVFDCEYAMVSKAKRV